MKKLLIALSVSLLFSSVASAAGTVGMNTATVNLNVRSAPVIAENRIDYMKAGTQVKVVEVVGRWCKLEYKNYAKAYSACEYLKPVTMEETTTEQPTETVPPVTEASCDNGAIQNFGSINVGQNEMKVIKVNTCGLKRYLACTQNPVGNPDLYGGFSSPTVDAYEQKSIDGFMADGTTTRPDCISFETTTSGAYYLGVYGAAPDTNTNIWVSSSPLKNIPFAFGKSLTWFSDTCYDLTTPKYGPFNTAWGNDEDLDRPFYDGYVNYIHGGVDIACPAYSEVKAMCNGTIVDSNDAGEGWGWHTVLECKKENSTISISFIHLNEESTLPIGTEVTTGQVIGTIYPMDITGEIVHLHLTGCKQSHADCEAAGFHPERGASRRTEWWGVEKFWFDMDWHSNPGLYKTLPSSR